LTNTPEKNRKREVVLPRQIAMFLIRNELNSSYPSIGEKFGGKDHTTVLYSCKRIEQDLIKDGEIKNIVEKLLTLLQR